jgi:membrane associated rhomboid family serine protease
MELSVTIVIIAITSIVSFRAFSNHRLVEQFIFYPPAVNRGQWYRFFSCGLIHADVGHLILNMLALYLFGIGSKFDTPGGTIYTGVEYRFVDLFGEKGRILYLAMYVLALAACLLPTYLKQRYNYHYRSLGASGAVSAVVFAGILFNPLQGIGLLFIPIFIAGFIFGIIYIFISSILERRGQDHINHSAHIFGALFGLGFTIIACQVIGDFKIVDGFVEQIKNANPKDFIHFGY